MPKTKNFIFNLAAKGLNASSALLFMPIILAILGAEVYGRYVTYLSIAYFLGNISNLNSEAINTANLISEKNNFKVKKNIYLPLQIKLLAFSIFIFGWYFSSLLIFDTFHEMIFFCFCSYPLVMRNLDLQYIIIAYQKFMILFNAVFIEKLIVLSGLILILYKSIPIFLVPLSFFVAALVNFFLCLSYLQKEKILVIKNILRLYEKSDYVAYLNLMKYSLFAKLTQPHVQLVKPICSYLLGFEATALYDILERLCNFCKMVSTVYFQSILKSIRLELEDFLKLTLRVVAIAAIMSIGIMSFLNTVITEFVKLDASFEFISHYSLVNIFLLLTVANLLSLVTTVMGSGYLLLIGYQKLYYILLIVINCISALTIYLSKFIITDLYGLMFWLMFTEFLFASCCLKYSISNKMSQ